jgi:N-methylhydantoinase A
VDRPAPLVRRKNRHEISERIDSEGNEIAKLDTLEAENVGRVLRRDGLKLVAISFLNSYKNPRHEAKCQRILRSILGKDSIVDCSSSVNPEYREYERTSTTVVNLLLKPLVSGYLRLLEGRADRSLEAKESYIMQSNGGLVSVRDSTAFPGKLIESGPASGLLGAADFGRRLKLGERILSLDMGGTTAKAGAVVNYTPLQTTEFEVRAKSVNGRQTKGSGYPVRFPILDLVEVSAGGGTIAWADPSGSLRVGPVSAGADPGPACYGRGSIRPTVTDANLLTGRLPKTLLGGTMKLDEESAINAMGSLSKSLQAKFESPKELSRAILAIVNLDMARAIRMVTFERGYDAREFVLVCFGGAGPLHCCELAELVGVSRIVVPEHPGIFSAIGVSVSKLTYDYVRPLITPIDRTNIKAAKAFLLKDARVAIMRNQKKYGRPQLRWLLESRYLGQSFSLLLEITNLELARPSLLRRRFQTSHRKRFGFSLPRYGIEAVNLRLEISFPLGKIATSKMHPVTSSKFPMESGDGSPRSERVVVLDADKSQTVSVFRWSHFPTGLTLPGPFCVDQYDSTLYVPPGWKARKDRESQSIFLSHKRSSH